MINHGWTQMHTDKNQTQRRRERGETQSKKNSVALSVLCASAFFRIRVYLFPSVVKI